MSRRSRSTLCFASTIRRQEVAALGIAGFPGGPTTVALNLYLHGDQAAANVAREAPLWEAWFQKRFPAPAER